MKKFILIFTIAASIFVIGCSSSTDKNIAGRWEVTSYANPFNSSSTLTHVADNEKYTLQLNHDGLFTFTTDCNIITGEYSTKGNKIQFINPSATEMACDKEIVERCVKSTLPVIVGYDLVNDSTLNLLGNEGYPLIKLIREPVSK